MSRAGRWVTAVGVVALATGCTPRASATDAASRRRIDIVERDFRLSAPHRLPAGDVTFGVRNDGPDDHEFIVVRADHQLPMRADGLTVDEDKVDDATAAALEPGEPHTTRELRAHL